MTVQEILQTKVIETIRIVEIKTIRITDHKTTVTVDHFKIVLIIDTVITPGVTNRSNYSNYKKNFSHSNARIRYYSNDRS